MTATREQDRLATADGEVSLRDEEMARLRRDVDSKTAEASRLRAELAARDVQLARPDDTTDHAERLTADVRRLEADLRALRESTSWRITAPIRALKNVGLWIRSGLHRPAPAAAAPPASSVGLDPNVTLISQSGLFDLQYYAAQAPEVHERGLDPVEHYLSQGADLGLDPHPLFDSSFYRQQNPDVAHVNPLVHYLRQGAAEGRMPHPLFEPAFYLEQKPHVGGLGVNLLTHFVAEGPTADFDPLSSPRSLPDGGICIVTPDIVGPVRNGGIGTACYHFARLLADAGRPVTIIYTIDLSPCRLAHWKNTYARMGIKFLSLSEMPPITHPVHGSNWFLDRSWRVFKYLQRHSYSVVHFQDWHANGFWSIKAKRLGLAFDETTLSVTTHSCVKWQDEGMEQFGPEPIETAKIIWAEAYAIEHCDALLSPSRYMLEWLAQNGIRVPAAVFVTPNAYTEKTDAAIASREVDNDHLVFFGRLEHRKGLQVFGDALRRLREERGALPRAVSFLGTHCTVNGQRSEEYLEQLRRDLHPIELRVINNLDHLGARDYIERTRGLVVIPSLMENCPFVVIECIANHLPFLAARTGGIPGMVDARVTFEPTAAGLAARLADRHTIDHAGMRHPYSVRDAARTWLDLHDQRGRFGDRSFPGRSTSDLGAAPRVSVCIRYFDHQRYLATLVTALQDQSHADLEVVVVNDGSGPESSHEFDRVGACTSDHRFCFLVTENRGPGAARNAAAEASTGELLLFLDADSLPKGRDMVATLVRALRASGADCLSCPYDIVSPDRVLPTEQDVISTYRPWGACLEAGFIENILGGATMLLPRSAFTRLGGFPTKRPSWEAHEFLLGLCLTGFTLETFPEPLLYRRESASDTDGRVNYYPNFRSLFEQLERAPSGELARIIAAVGGPMLVTTLGLGTTRKVCR